MTVDCNGCTGTCCTGVGSEPCTCEPLPEDYYRIEAARAERDNRRTDLDSELENQ